MKIDLKSPVRLNLYQDEDNSNHWYLHFTKDGQIEAKIKSGKHPSLVFSAANIKNLIYDHFGHSGKHTLKFNVGEVSAIQGIRVHPITLIKESLDLVIPGNKERYNLPSK